MKHHRVVVWLCAALFSLVSLGWTLTAPIPDAPGAVRSTPLADVVTYTLFMPLLANHPAPVAPSDDWLGALNYYRALADLPPVARATAYLPPEEYPGMAGVDPNEACRKHTRYMVKTQTATHNEDLASPWYTREGSTSAASSVLLLHFDASLTDGQGLAYWIATPFHLIGAMGLASTHAAFGSYRERGYAYPAAFALTSFSPEFRVDRSQYPPGVRLPVTFPRDGGYTPVLAFWGETPDPLGYCPGYSAPAGPVTWIAFGHFSITRRYIQRVDAVSFHENGQPRDFCLLRCTYGDARAYLCTYEHLMLLPRHPLTPGARYTASVTVTFSPLCEEVYCGPDWSETHTWSFDAVKFE